MKVRLKLLVLFLVFSATGFAQRAEKEFTGYPTSQLQFSTYYLALPKVKYENQFRELGSSPAFGFQMGLGYYQALKNGFGLSFQAQARIQNSRLDLLWRDYNNFNNDSFDIVWKNRHIMPSLSTPIFLEKHFILGQRHWLNAAIGVGVTYFPFENMLSAIVYERQFTDSTAQEVLSYYYQKPTRKAVIDFRTKVGYKFMLKNQNTISVNVNYTYSPFKVLDVVTNRIINGDFLQSGRATQTLSYIGLELAYAYSLRKQFIEKKHIGIIKPEREVKNRPNKLWIETSISVVHVRQLINQKNDFFETDIQPQVKYNWAVELDKNWNQRYAFSYLRYWEVEPKISLSPYDGAGATGVYQTFFTSASFGKDLIKSKNERFKVKPWIGGAISLYPFSFIALKYPDPYRNEVWSEASDSLSYSFLERNPNPFNVLMLAALEFEIRLHRSIKFSITPSYTQGMLKNSIASYSYNYNNIETGNFDLVSRLSHTELRFALKIPIHYGKQVN